MVNDQLTKLSADIHDLLVQTLGTNQVWVDMADVFGQVLLQNVEDPIAQLETLRNISQKSDPELLNLTARLLGFDVSQDILNLNADNLTKVVSQLSHYQDQNGTEIFNNFIDLVLNSRTEIVALFTKDYVNFLTKVPSGERLLIDGGTWFKTTHVEFRTTLPSSTALNLRPGQTLLNRIQEIFYNFAPIALVIDRTSILVEFNDSSWNSRNGAVGIASGLGFSTAFATIE